MTVYDLSLAKCGPRVAASWIKTHKVLRHIYKLLEAEKFKKVMKMKTIKIQAYYFPLNYLLPFRYCFRYIPFI
jgi:hypothetical protein